MSANDVTHPNADLPPDPDLAALIGQYADWAGGLMPALHAVQHHAGWVNPELFPLLADTFNLSVAEVHGVVTFYGDFRTTPPNGPVVQVCRAEACQARGANTVLAHALAAATAAGVEVHEVF